MVKKKRGESQRKNETAGESESEIRNELEKEKEGQIEMRVGQVCGGKKKSMDAIKFGKII